MDLSTSQTEYFIMFVPNIILWLCSCSKDIQLLTGNPGGPASPGSPIFPWLKTETQLSVNRFYLPCQGETQYTMIYNPNWNYYLACNLSGLKSASVMTLIVYSWVWYYKCSIYNETDANVIRKNLAAFSMPMKKRTILA